MPQTGREGQKDRQTRAMRMKNTDKEDRRTEGQIDNDNEKDKCRVANKEMDLGKRQSQGQRNTD